MRLRDEVLDLEDFNESVAFNQFTLDDFRLDLSNFIAANKSLLTDAPLGLYAVVPVQKQAPEQDQKASSNIKAGVIYCLRQTTAASASESKTGKAQETVNPLSPFFLVYIQADGTVRYNFTAPKQVLDIFRALCQGQTAPYADLCKLFDTETRHGQDMRVYSALLDKAVKAIVAQFGQKNAANLFSGRGGKLIDAGQAVQGQQDFELVTWLVIK
jgi:hypothetical protein